MAQLPVVSWVKHFEPHTHGHADSHGRSVGIDRAGNVYTAGVHQGQVDFDPGPGTFMMITEPLYSSGIYISKLDAAGNFVWAKQINARLSWSPLEIAVDGDGNVYIVTDTYMPTDVDPGPSVYTITPTGGKHIIIIKLDANGNFVWAKQIGAPGDTVPQADIITLDPNNDILIGGQFNHTIDFDPGPGVYNLTASNHIKSFILKLSKSGEMQWAKKFGEGPDVHSMAAIVDMTTDATGNIILTGSFGRTCDFDPGPAEVNVTSSPGASGDGYVCKLDRDGNFIWVKTFGQTIGNNHLMRPNGVATDASGSIVITGSFIGDYDFNPGPGSTVYHSNPFDCFVVKLTATGNFAWAKVIGGSDSDHGTDVVVDQQDNVYICGSFGPAVDFDPGTGVHTIISPHYGPNAVVKLSASGDFRYAAAFKSLDDGLLIFRRMVNDASGQIYITGQILGENDFDPGPGIDPVRGHGPLILKLAPCANLTSAILHINACDSYTLNGTLYDTAGIFTQVIPNSSGCDSVITLHLSIDKKRVQLSKEICEGEFLFAGGALQTMPGIYYDTLQTSMGCDSVIVTSLTVNPLPKPVLGADRSLCLGKDATLSPGTFAQYSWYNLSAAPTLTVSSPGTYWVTVTNQFNCQLADTVIIQSILPAPAQFLKATDSVCTNSELTLEADRSFNQYLWSNGGTARKTAITDAGVYWLIVTDTNGCSGTDSTVVYSKNCGRGVHIPNAFTPNNDGLNDVFRAAAFENLKSFQLSIYNREGQLIFHTTKPSVGWDGSYKSMHYSTATFVWHCAYQIINQPPQYQKGTVTLIR